MNEITSKFMNLNEIWWKLMKLNEMWWKLIKLNWIWSFLSVIFIKILSKIERDMTCQNSSNRNKLAQRGSNWIKFDGNWLKLIELIWIWSYFIKIHSKSQGPRFSLVSASNDKNLGFRQFFEGCDSSFMKNNDMIWEYLLQKRRTFTTF